MMHNYQTLLLTTALFTHSATAFPGDEVIPSEREGIPPLKLKATKEHTSPIPTAITHVAPGFCFKKAGFGENDGSAELANNFFSLFNILRETPTPLASKKERREALYFSLLMSAYHLGRSIEDAPLPMRPSLLITQAQIRTRALDYAGSDKTRASLRSQIQISLANASESITAVSDSKTKRKLQRKIDSLLTG